MDLKVKELENQVLLLKHQVDKYKQIIDSLNILEETKGDINKFVEDETFCNCGIPNLIDKNPVLVNSTMIDQMFDLVGPFGSERVSCLKKAFKIIIDNVLPLHAKMILKCLNEK